MKTQAIVFTAKERAELLTRELPEMLPDQVLVKSDYSLISAGTELANYHALPNTAPTHYLADGAPDGYPVEPGYSTSGHVIKVGSAVKEFQEGDKVLVFWNSHKSRHLVNASSLYKIPEGIDMQEACFGNLISFPMLGVRKLELQLGECAMVAGLGLLGLFAVQFARLSGACPVLACDFSPERREMARRLGADCVFDPREENFRQKVIDASGGTGPHGVVEVTGSGAALQQALEYVAWEGRISLLGCTRVADQPVDFYRYVHKTGVRIVGAHALTRPQQESRPGEWTLRDDFRTMFRLMKTGRLQVRPLISRLVSPADCDAVYHDIGFSQNPIFGNVFDWTKMD